MLLICAVIIVRFVCMQAWPCLLCGSTFLRHFPSASSYIRARMCSYLSIVKNICNYAMEVMYVPLHMSQKFMSVKLVALFRG